MLAESGSGHSAGALGMVEIFTALYFKVLKISPKDPTWSKRDRLVLSAGHICPVLYAALAERGYFPRKELLSLRAIGSRLQGHPRIFDLPGIENSSGSLGQGLSQALGISLALKNKAKVYAILSDGEHQEGQIWEAVMWAGHHKLNNLITIIDRNSIQISGSTEQILGLGSLSQKYQSFGWNTLEISGNDLEEVCLAFEKITARRKGPWCIVANTVSGYGVDFISGDYRWHGKVPTPVQAEQAAIEIWKPKSISKPEN